MNKVQKPDFDFNLGKLWFDHITKFSKWLEEKIQAESSLAIVCDVHFQTINGDQPDAIIDNSPFDFLSFYSAENVAVDKHRGFQINFSIDESSQSVRVDFLDDDAYEIEQSVYLLLKDFEKPEVITELNAWLENLTKPVFLYEIDRAS